MTQPNQIPDADQLLMGGGAPAADLKTIGSSVEGFVTAKDVVQEREFRTNTPKTFKDGNPIWQLVVSVQTNLRDPQNTNDDGIRRIFFKQQWRQELAKQLRAHNVDTLPLGAWIRLVRTHDEPGQGSEPKKMVSVEYRGPADAAIMAPAPQPVSPQPVYQQAPQYQPPTQQAPVQQVVGYQTGAPGQPPQPIYQQVQAPQYQAPAAPVQQYAQPAASYQPVQETAPVQPVAQPTPQPTPALPPMDPALLAAVSNNPALLEQLKQQGVIPA